MEIHWLPAWLENLILLAHVLLSCTWTLNTCRVQVCSQFSARYLLNSFTDTDQDIELAPRISTNMYKIRVKLCLPALFDQS